MIHKTLARLAVLAGLVLLVANPAATLADPAHELTSSNARRVFPVTFDLRNVNGNNYVTPVKTQRDGTCWAHGTMAAIESGMLKSDVPWEEYNPGQSAPNMDEYHLDWWNGFNQHYNADIYPTSGEGLEVHQGGDYLVAAAYLSRNDGAIDICQTDACIDTMTLHNLPSYIDPEFDYYYPREIEWLTTGTESENIDAIKEALQTYGAVATALCSHGEFMIIDSNDIRDWTHYQPPSDTNSPDHSVAIIGWDDTKVTEATNPGAWLCKNSKGTSYGVENGYFWISFFDKFAGHHPEMGAVSFHDVEIVGRRQVYYHDYHGWRDTRGDVGQALAAFTSVSERMLSDVSFITAEDNVTYSLLVYDDFNENSGPSDTLSSAEGTADHKGLHTVALDSLVRLPAGEDFYVELTLSSGGMAYDHTSLIPVLLGTESDPVLVRSTSAPNECFYLDDSDWVDLYVDDTTASFCIKALADKSSPIGVSDTVGTAPLSVTFSADESFGSVLKWRFDDTTESSATTPTHSFSRLGLHNVAVDMSTSNGNVSVNHRRAFGVQADTLSISTVNADLNWSVKVDVTLHNYLPIDQMVIPFVWSGPLELAFDSISVAGCLTQDNGSATVVDSDPSSQSAAVMWVGDSLQAGSGTIVSLFFTVLEGDTTETDTVTIEAYGSYSPQLHAVGLANYVPTLIDGSVTVGCCEVRVGDADNSGSDEPTVGDVSVMVDAKFIAGTCVGLITCLSEADVNQSGGSDPTCDDISIGDINILVDYLFITGPSLGLPNCF